ncbi:AsmA family protein [endosymbiont of unidentified scaly snail isolate Monju]|uniref:AsmA family protein n=1 Tax=endosymbiont of unidentified scaly snail isolate Monju TaxID=1248727 RepID=UPI0003891D97|nr:AsmA family protein [endosymbiont of unidentified scaly snail isolate Monju]BAN69588.1 AsmA protein [endosymbiont of unidentified scaly snail isolate Monju]
MGKFLKIVLGVVLVLVVLIAAAVVVLPMVVDPNDYKDRLVAEVKQQTGRDLAIEQPLKLSVFPWLGVETGGVTLGNAPGFGKQPFAQVRRLGVRVKLLPLLSRNIEVDTLVLEGAEINLARNADGQTNWDDLAGKGEQASDEPAGGGKAEGGRAGGGPAIVSLKVQGIQLRDARISWRDEQTGASYVLDKVRLETGALAPGAQVPVAAGFTLSSSRPRVDVTLELNTEARVSEDLRRFSLKGLRLVADGKGEGLPSSGMRVEVAADVDADTLAVSGLTVQGPAVAITGQLDVAGLQQAPRLKGHLELADTNLKQLAALFGNRIETTDPRALTQVSLKADLSHEGKATRIEPFEITLDDTHAKGFVRLLDARGPVLRARLDVDGIDLDRYLPPRAQTDKASGKASGGDKAAGKAAADPADDPFAGLRSLDLEADLKIGKLTVNKARLQDVTVRLVSKGGVLKAAPVAARLYQGKFNGKVTLDARKKTPRLHLVENLQGVQIGPLLADVAGQDKLVGTGDLKLDLRLTGLSEAEVRRSLNGNGSFVFREGAYKGVDLVKLIRTATGQGRNTTQTGNTAEQTEFTEMRGSFTARNGVISNHDLSAKSPLLRVAGKGDVDLPANRIDYTVTAKLVASLQGQGGAEADQLAGVPIPVRIQGALDKPGYTLDVEALLRAKARQRLEREKAKLRTKVEQKVQEKLKGALGDKLRGLFGR